MTHEKSSFQNLTPFEGYYPPNSATHLKDPRLSEELASENPFGLISELSVEKGCWAHLEYESRRRAFERVLQKLSAKELLGREHIEGYMRHKYRCNFKEKTISGTFTSVAFFGEFLKGKGKVYLEEMRREDLEAFIEYEQDRGLKISTVKTRLAHLYAFIGFLIEKGAVDAEIVRRRMRLRIPDSLPRSMDPDEVDLLVVVEGPTRDRAMVLVLLRTGMRIGELLRTKVNDVHLEERKIMIYEGEKNALGRVVYFTDDARDALRAWFRERAPQEVFLFYGRGGNPLTYQASRMMFGKYLQKAGLSHKGYTLHSLRHTYATELLNAGMPLECLQQLLGHSNIEITRRYARLSDKTREEEYFRAMSIIERREKDGHYKLDRELQAIFEEKELLASHREQLHEQS
jgi:site-specific recombinase XerD